MIVHQRNQLVCPNYSEGYGYVGHDDLFWALDREAEARLVPGDFVMCTSRDGGDPFDALEADLRDVVLPA